MIPKTVLRYSSIYNKQFDKNFSFKDLEKLKKDCKNFEKLYKQNIKEILELIEKYHNKKWKYKFIPIYIVKDNKSFSDPLTLKYKENSKLMLIILAHELLHNNITKKFKKSKDLHKYMEPILNKIISKLTINLNKELTYFNNMMKKK